MNRDDFMKVIFLDFDGVLNSEKYIRKCECCGVIIDPARMFLLKQIVDATEAVIVLSTSWREHWNIKKENCDETGIHINIIFQQHGLNIFDKTPKLSSGRENEIKMWLDEHNEIEGFVVIDDAFLSADYLSGHFVKTSNYRNGLEEQDVKTAIEILNVTR